MATNLAKRATPNGRRIRLPLYLVYSRHHSPLAVSAYALLDLLSGPDRGPVEARRDWIAGRLGASLGGTAKALAALAAEHAGAGAVADAPAYMVSTPRGKGWTATREILPGVPFVDVPELALGDDVNGPRVSHLAFRLYAILVAKRAPRRATVTLPRADVAALLRVRVDSLPALYRELAAAELLVVVDRPGTTTMLLPLLRQTTQAERDEVHAHLTACGDPVDKPITALSSDDGPDASTGSTPHASTGTAPGPSAGTASKSPDLGRRDLVDPRDAAPAPCGAGGPADATPAPVVVADAAQVVADFAGAAGRRAAAREAAAAAAARFAEQRTAGSGGGMAALRDATGAAGAWCGTCERGSRRVILDSGALGAACPDCRPEAMSA